VLEFMGVRVGVLMGVRVGAANFFWINR